MTAEKLGLCTEFNVLAYLGTAAPNSITNNAMHTAGHVYSDQ